MDSMVVRAKKSVRPEIARSIEIACKRLSAKALDILEKAMNDEKLDMKHRLDAAKEILNRGWGRPKQSVDTNINVNNGDALLAALTSAKDRAGEATKLISVLEKTSSSEDKPTLN